MSEQTSTYAPDRGSSFAGVLALLIALLICLPAQAQMAPPMTQRTMPGQMANPMMMPNTNPNMMPNNGGNMNGGMGGNTGGMNGNMGGTMMNPSGGMRMPYMQRMPNAGGGAAPSSGQRTTPSFVGLTRSEASALAAQYGLVAAFDGATSENARVASQTPEAGVLIFRSAMPIRFQMEAPAPRAPQQTAAPATPAPEPQTASPAAQATPPPATPSAQAGPPPSTPAAAPAKPALTRAVAPPPPPPPPVTPSRNWWVLLAIAAGLAGAMWLLFGKRKTPEPIAHGFDNPPAGAMAQLATQIVSNGLAEAAVSLGGAAAPRFELSYVVEHDAQADQIGISVGGGKDGG